MYKLLFCLLLFSPYLAFGQSALKFNGNLQYEGINCADSSNNESFESSFISGVASVGGDYRLLPIKTLKLHLPRNKPSYIKNDKGKIFKYLRNSSNAKKSVYYRVDEQVTTVPFNNSSITYTCDNVTYITFNNLKGITANMEYAISIGTNCDTIPDISCYIKYSGKVRISR